MRDCLIEIAKMIRIFNKKLKKSILIDESFPQVSFEPRQYEDNPYVRIKLSGIHFSNHAMSCDECSTFQKSFGTDSMDWHIEFLGRTRRLNLSKFGDHENANKVEWRLSPFFSGSTLKLNICTDTVESLSEELHLRENIEDYEGCSKIHLKMQSILSTELSD
jgi:hypothetical protein